MTSLIPFTEKQWANHFREKAKAAEARVTALEAAGEAMLRELTWRDEHGYGDGHIRTVTETFERVLKGEK